MLKLPRHNIEVFARCGRKWYYRYKLGLVPKQLPEHLIIGSLFHLGAAKAFKTGECPTEFDTEDLSYTMEQYNLVLDMLRYWWLNSGKEQYENVAEILAIEKTFYLKVGDYGIPATPDLVYRHKDGQIVIVDHKTVGNIKDALGFLAIDPQMKRYAATIYQEYGEIPEIEYNMIRRDLPPDYIDAVGEMPYSLTKTGRKSTKTTNVIDYLRLERLLFTPKQIEATKDELHDIILDLEQAIQNNRFTRRVIKGGSYGCSSCEFFGPCVREADGNKLDGITLKQYYTEEQTPFS